MMKRRVCSELFPNKIYLFLPNLCLWKMSELGHTKININKILWSLTSDWFLVTRFQTLIVVYEGSHALSSTNIQLNMISISHDSFAIKMFSNILCY